MRTEIQEHVNLIDITPTECSVITSGLSHYYYELKTNVLKALKCREK